MPRKPRTWFFAAAPLVLADATALCHSAKCSAAPDSQKFSPCFATKLQVVLGSESTEADPAVAAGAPCCRFESAISLALCTADCTPSSCQAAESSSSSVAPSTPSSLARCATSARPSCSLSQVVTSVALQAFILGAFEAQTPPPQPPHPPAPRPTF